jgi:hypothetical protein
VKINIQEDSVGNKHIGVDVFGYDLIVNSILNKGRSFSVEEKESLKLLGLVPPGIVTLKEEVEKTYHILKKKLMIWIVTFICARFKIATKPCFMPC